MRSFFFAALLTLGLGSFQIFSQSTPDDPNHLPKKIGGDDQINNRVDATTVAGKVILRDWPANKPRPSISIAVYRYGRLVVRRNVPESGSYTISDVPREGSTLILEVDKVEIETRQILPGPAMIIYQDFQVSMTQTAGQAKPGVISPPLYARKQDAQEKFDKAVADISTGKTDRGIETLKALVADDAKDFPAWTQLGNGYFLKKDHSNAESAYTKALSAQPTFVPAMVNLGKLYMVESKNDQAIDILGKAVAAEPRSADAQQLLGEAYLAIKKGSKAVIYLNEALKLAPVEKADIHLRLAALYNGAGLKSRASAEYKMYLEKVPNTDRRSELQKYITENPPGQ